MTLTLQSIATGIVLYFIYLLFGPAKYIEVDTINEFVYLLLIPVILIGTTWLVCFLVGLPLRLVSSLHNWWKAKQLFVALIIIVGLVALGQILKPNFAEFAFDIIVPKDKSYSTPVDTLSIIIWFFTSFCLLHFYPKSLFRQIKERTKKALPPT